MFTKIGMFIDIVEIWFGIANRHISSNFELSARDTPIFSFKDDNLSKCQVILTKLGTCIDTKEIWFEMGKFCQCLTELPARDTIMAGYYSLKFYYLIRECVGFLCPAAI